MDMDELGVEGSRDKPIGRQELMQYWPTARVVSVERAGLSWMGHQ